MLAEAWDEVCTPWMNTVPSVELPGLDKCSVFNVLRIFTLGLHP